MGWVSAAAAELANTPYPIRSIKSPGLERYIYTAGEACREGPGSVSISSTKIRRNTASNEFNEGPELSVKLRFVNGSKLAWKLVFTFFGICGSRTVFALLLTQYYIL